MNYEIKQEESTSKGSFYIEQEGSRVGEIAYSKAGSDLIIIADTMIDDSLRGTGAGQQLVLKAVDWAREKNIKIIPLCPFANSVFQKHPELHDVLK
jgi:predicted GNAT family acetyltransferase